MRCPACDVENADGAKVCTSCGKDLTQAAAATAPAPPAATATGRRFSKLAILSLLAPAIAPSMQVQSNLGGGWRWLEDLLGRNYWSLEALTWGAMLFFAIGLMGGIVAGLQILKRSDLRGGALAVGGLVLGASGLAATSYGPELSGRFGEVIQAMAGAGPDTYVWRTTVIVLAAAVLCEIVLLLSGPAAKAAASPAEEPVPAAKE